MLANTLAFTGSVMSTAATGTYPPDRPLAMVTRSGCQSTPAPACSQANHLPVRPSPV